MLVELWRRRSVSIKQEHSSEAAVCFSEDATDQAVADGVGLQQVAAESYGRFVVASMLFAHIAPRRRCVGGGQRIEHILPDQGDYTAGKGQATEG